MRRTLRGSALVGALAVVAMLAFAANALAVSGTAIKIAEPIRFGNPSVAVDGAGTAYIAWAHEVVGGEELVGYCVLPAGTTGCVHSGSLPVVENSAKGAHIERVQTLVDGTTVVVLANLYGTEGEEFEPTQEWQSTDGGATFVVVNGGKSVARATVNADTGAIGAVVVPGTDALGYAAITAGGPPTFNEFPFSTPTTCSNAKPCPFATLQAPSLNELGNLGGVVASRLGTSPGILGVYETLGKPGCASGTFDTAYAYGNGEQSATNNYNLSPGVPKSAWKELTAGDCEVEYPAVGGGPSGLGVAEKDLASGYEIYHKFNQTTGSFEPSTVTIAKEGGLDTSVSQDGAGGIYVTYLGNAEDAIRLAYSSDGGASWTGPATLNPNTDLGAAHLVSSVGSDGQGWAVWDDGESVFAQQFDAADAIPPATPTTLITSQTSGTTTGANLTIPAGTVGESDKATIAGANAATAIGTVSYALYSSSSCSAASKLTSSTVAVTGGGVPPSAPITAALAPGAYYWQAAYGSEVLTITAVAPTSLLTIPKQTDTVGSKGGMSVVVDCAGAKCTGSLTLVVKVKKTIRKGKKKKTKTVVETIGTALFSSLALGTDTIAIKLDSKGLSLLKHDGYKLKSTASATYLSGAVFKIATGDLALKGHKPKKKKK
jgi:hypothetical protein